MSKKTAKALPNGLKKGKQPFQIKKKKGKKEQVVVLTASEKDVTISQISDLLKVKSLPIGDICDALHLGYNTTLAILNELIAFGYIKTKHLNSWHDVLTTQYVLIKKDEKYLNLEIDKSKRENGN